MDREKDQKNDPEQRVLPRLPLLSNNEAEYQACFEEKSQPLGIDIVFGERNAEQSESQADADVQYEIHCPFGGHSNFLIGRFSSE
ncbi:MAG TPA: hypothetical protein VF283_08325 [Bryobacteraceae bacterium]